MGIFGPGELMGLVRLFDDPLLPYGFVAREPALVAHLPCRGLVAIFDADPLRWKEVTRFALDRQVDTLDTLLNQAVLGRTDCRIAATLQRLGNLFGVQAARETRLRLRLSQDDLADMLAVSRQTVNKELRRLEAAGILRCTYNTLVILDRGALSRMAAERRH
ncbi:hypothetical protein AX767_01705 [Variovorax sp. PAMC 28711]|nr:hypothetical protein AX767_01705 [Variovorax sp. PAMC 28711]